MHMWWKCGWQEEALAATRRLLEQHLTMEEARAVHLHLGCHSQLRQFLRGTEGAPADLRPPRLICFNLGAAEHPIHPAACALVASLVELKRGLRCAGMQAGCLAARRRSSLEQQPR